MKRISICLLPIYLLGCADETPAPPSRSSAHMVAVVPKAVPAQRMKLDWETDHPKRAPWSDVLIADLSEHFSSFARASDASVFHPRWRSLTRDQQMTVLAEMIVWTAYYESAWDPADYSVDVGSKIDNRTWSVGLLQLSVVDQANHHLPFGYSFADLQDPIKNLHLGIAIMAKQIDRHGKILIPVGESGVYWGTLHPGRKYDRSALIESHTRSLVFLET